MILCMPFTYLSDHHIDRLSKMLGPIAVCQPAGGIAPASMRTWADRGLLTFVVPQGVDAAHLQGILVEYRQWAQLHAGQLWDRAGAAIAANGRPPLVGETTVTQLQTSIRHYDDPSNAPAVDILLQAAFFLAVCQEHDQQQAVVDSSLASVNAMEHTMFALLSGEETGPAGGAPLAVSSPAVAVLSPEMIERRLRSWAILARHTATPPDALITCSAPVFDALLERFGQASRLGTCAVESFATRVAWPDVLADIAAASDPVATARRLLPQENRADAASTLALVVLPDCPPARVLAELGAEIERRAVTPPDWCGPKHTVIGRMDFEGA